MAVNLRALAQELANDPLGRGYGQMTDAQVAADLNAPYRTADVRAVSGDVCFQAIDADEFAALPDHRQALWLAFCARETIDPFAPANIAFVRWLFGADSITATNLAKLRTRPVTRAEELGLGRVREGDVQRARRELWSRSTTESL